MEPNGLIWMEAPYYNDSMPYIQGKYYSQIAH